MAVAHESACSGFPECLDGSAVVSMSVGGRTLFRVLTHGGPIEQLRLQTDQRWLNAMAIYLIVAWRIHSITMAGRTYPDVPCEIVFDLREWHTIYPLRQHRHPPPAPPSLREIVRALAQLGGFVARTGDGEPGI
jgi:hypothetical protein